MKSKITYNSRLKFYRPNLFLLEKTKFKSEYHWSENGYEQRGWYQSSECTIIISILVGWIKDRPELTTLNCDYGGFSYQRNYSCLLSDHALKLACAKFCKDIINQTPKKPKHGKKR